MVRLKQQRRAALLRDRVDLGDDALHAALVVFVGAVDVKEFESDPLRRTWVTLDGHARDTAIE